MCDLDLTFDLVAKPSNFKILCEANLMLNDLMLQNSLQKGLECLFCEPICFLCIGVVFGCHK